MPGIPKNPATSAVTGFIAIDIAKGFPAIFMKKRIMPPIMPFNMILIKILRGTTKSQPKK
jgi:hypothetical protein